MRYTIVSDIPGRLRLRCGTALIDEEEAYGIAHVLMDVPGVRAAEVHTANGSILVAGDPAMREQVLAAVDGLDVLHLPRGTEDSDLSLTKADNDFALRLSTLVVWRLLRKLALPLPLRYAWTVVRAVPRILLGVRHLFAGELTVEVLDAAAVTASLLRGAFSDASSVLFLLQISDILQDHVQRRARLALAEGMVERAETVWQVVDGQDVRIALADVREGIVLHMHSGQVLPVDGMIVAGAGEFNEATMTGESRPVHKGEGLTVYAGTALEDGDVQIEVTARPGRARIDEIVSMVQDSSELKAASQSRAEHLADALVPWSFAAFFGVLAVTRNVQRALAVLMVDYSCAIKISTPVAVMSAMKEGVDRDIVIKGGKYLEAFADADTIVFDKTGTLTVAAPRVEKILLFADIDEETVLRYAACIEEHYPHSVARAIVNAARERGLHHEDELHADVRYIVAHGISTEIEGKHAVIGSSHFVFEDEGVERPADMDARIKREAPTASLIYLAVDGRLVAVACVGDPIRPEAAGAIARLRELGIGHVVMLTGDSKHAALAVAGELGVDTCFYQVLPEDKSSYVQRLRDEGHTVIMVGDGINDSPALAAANVSVALSDASDIARAVADVSVREATLESLVTMRILSQRLMRRIQRKYRFIVGFNSALIALGVAQVITITTAALAHNASTIAIAAHNTTPLLPAGADLTKSTDNPR